MRFARISKLVPDDRRRPHRTGVEQGEHPFKMGAVTHDVRTERFNIAPGWSKPFGRRSNPNQSTTGSQHCVTPGPDIAANGVKYNVAIGNSGRKVLNIIVDHPISAETEHIGMIAGAGRGDYRGAKMFGKLDGESSNASGASLDQNCLARF